MRPFSSTFVLFMLALLGGTPWNGVLAEDKVEWESRAILGWHQAGASSAESAQNLFFDFYVARPLGKEGAVYDNAFSLWGQVRVASSPQQRTIPLSEFAAGFVEQIGKIPVN